MRLCHLVVGSGNAGIRGVLVNSAMGSCYAVPGCGTASVKDQIAPPIVRVMLVPWCWNEKLKLQRISQFSR